MKFLFASDSFKGTLSSSRIAELLTTAAKESFPDCICTNVETADGGEGTTEAVLDAVNGQRMFLTVHGPLWKKTDCFYGKLDERRAVMEMAAASGLPLLQEVQRDPRKTTTYGTGEMIQDALDHGFRDISIAIGGSATNDGGMGCMCALGVRFLDQEGRELTGCGENLGKIARIDLSDLDPRITETKFTVMCDVNNPLCGENGATYTFGGQKGGTPEILEELETGMLHYRELLLETFQVDVNEVPGAGAAGGLGAALVVFLNATLKSGIETVLDLVDFDTRLQGVSLVVTGEGCTDWQSAFGKVLHGVGMRCKKYHIPVVALAGSMGQGAEQIYESGIDSILTTVNAPMELHTALEQAEELYLNAARRLFRMLKVGFQMKETEEQSDQ